MLIPLGKAAELIDSLADASNLLILTHNNPDPDSIGAAFGLRHIIVSCKKIKMRLAYGGVVGRAENRAMIKLLRIPISHITPGIAARYRRIAIVDAQPTGKNLILPGPFPCDIVIDHHLSGRKVQAGFADLRAKYGATSTIVAEYIKESGIPLNARVATALFYGIKTDIDDLGRGTSDEDIRMMQFLFPKISLKWLRKIEKVKVPLSYFRYYSDGIDNALIHHDVITSDLVEVDAPEAVAELADFLLKVEGVQWSFCCGHHKGRIYFSMRSRRKGKKAGRIAVALAGRKGSAGGHDHSAGGFVPLIGEDEEEIERMKKDLTARFCKRLGRENAAPVPLVPGKKSSITTSDLWSERDNEENPNSSEGLDR